MNDIELIEGIKRGKEENLSFLMDNYINYVVKIITSIGGKILKKEDIEETCSDVFVAIWHNRKKLKTDTDIKPYIAQIARNMTKNKLRELSKNSDFSDTDIEILEDTFNLSEKMITEEKITAIQDIINNFDSPEREIVYGYYFYELKLTELAERLNIPLSTVKTKLYRSRDRLKEILR